MLKLLAFLAWLMIPLGLWYGVQTYGTPHLVTSYRFYDNGDRYNPWARRHYIDCSYLGIDGWVTVPARHARCPWVRILKARP